MCTVLLGTLSPCTTIMRRMGTGFEGVSTPRACLVRAFSRAAACCSDGGIKLEINSFFPETLPIENNKKSGGKV